MTRAQKWARLAAAVTQLGLAWGEFKLALDAWREDGAA